MNLNNPSNPNAFVSNSSQEIVTAAGIDTITDLFPSTPVAPRLATTAPVVAVEFSTDEMQIAVALVVNGYGEPELREVGRTKDNTPKVEFVFPLPAGETPRSIENKFWKKGFTGEISQIFVVTRALKKRISRLPRTA